MDPLPSLQPFLSMLSLGAWTLVAIAVCLLIYGYVFDRVIFESGGRVRSEKLGPIDVLIAALLTTFFALSVIDALRSPAGTVEAALPSASRMITALAVSTFLPLVIVGGIFGALSLRGVRWREIFGLDRLGPGAVAGCALLMLAAALPLVGGASFLSRVLLAAGGSQDDSKQEIVRFLEAGGSTAARYAVALSAVLAAPVLEEFIFRGYLYAVVRRYAGVSVGIIVNAALFAAIHQHLPSFGGLFALAVCLTLAYEWTGSIFVPITMHAIFNALSVAQLLQGNTGG